ncbi:kinase-like domain-containing protein [Camillea tinctor]|nr:kinase-like domain-containing protein [Camillea tinctor]
MLNIDLSAEESELDRVSDFLEGYDQERAPISVPHIHRDLQPLEQKQLNRPLSSDVGSYVSDYGAGARIAHQGRDRSSLSHPHGNSLGIEDAESEPPLPSNLENTGALSDGQNIQKSLHATLLNSSVESATDKSKRFLPSGQLDAKCTKDAIRKELQRVLESSRNIEKYVAYICGDERGSECLGKSSRMIFCILAIMKEVQLIVSLVGCNINDEYLPFRWLGSSNGNNNDDYILVGRNHIDGPNSRPSSCFDRWETWQKLEFYRIQWTLLAPYITKAPDNSVTLYHLAPEAILPWTEFQPMHDGGYGNISRVKIHPDHHSFDDHVWFAFKSLKDPDDEAFHREFQALKRFGTGNHSGHHLLQACAAFKHGNQCSFLFPWASGGSLKDLWQHHPLSLLPSESSFRNIILWVASQLAGLTGESGLGGLHDANLLNSSYLPTTEFPKYYGIHGDIKPENILHFQGNDDEYSLGVLKIADFGLTGFHSPFSRSLQPPSGPCSPSYRAPESEVEDEFRTRKYDTWSLGCVLSEFMTWLIYGPDALAEFENERAQERKVNVPGQFDWQEDSFFNIIIGYGGQKKVAVKKSVESWIDGLMAKVNGENYLHDCLDFIKKELLNVNRGERADCVKTHKFLKGLYERCRQDISYTTFDLPGLSDPVEFASQPPPPPIQISVTNKWWNTIYSENRERGHHSSV